MNNYKEIYELAGEIRKLEPWTRMEEADVFGVRIPGTDRVYFLSVMGALGEWTAISAYRGLEGLSGFYKLHEEGDVLPPETILTVPHLMLSFREREGLSPEQLANIKSSGISFRGNGNWPSLEMTEPGFFPELPQGPVLEDAMLVYKQALEVFRRTREGTDFLYEEHETFDSMLVREPKEVAGKVKWTDSYVPITELEYSHEYKKEVPEAKVEAVFRLPESRTIVQLELALIPAPVKEKGKKGYFPFGLLLADKKNGLMLGMEMLPPLPDMHQMYEKVPEAVLDQVIKLGFRPTRFEIRSDILFHLVNSSLLRAGCRVLGVKRMEVMDEFIQSLSNHLGGETDQDQEGYPMEESEWDDEESEWDDEEIDDIYEQFLPLEAEQKVDVIYKLMDGRPDLDEDLLDMIEDVSSELIFLHKPEQLEQLIARYSELFPELYEEYYENTEKELIGYYLFRGDLTKAKKHLKYIRRDPVTGVDGATPYAFFLLLFRGHTRVALDLAGDIWEELEASDELIAYAHAPYCNALYLNILEKAWLQTEKGVKTDWKKFRKQVESFGIEWEAKKIKVIAGALENPFPREAILTLMKQGRQADLMLMLNIHFLIFMKKKWDVPFVLSDLWWNMLMDEDLFGKEKEAEAYFYVHFEYLELRFIEQTDMLFRANEVELFGRTFGLKYAYYFLKVSGLIGEPWYRRMLINIEALEIMRESFSKYQLWEMTFVFDWPEIIPFDKDRKKIYESTFSLNEDHFEDALDAYFDRRLESFPKDMAANLREAIYLMDIELDPDFDPEGDEVDDDELPW